MKILNLKNGLFIAALLASGGALSGLCEREWHGAEQTLLGEVLSLLEKGLGCTLA